MLWKLLLTAAVVFGAYGVIRARARSTRIARGLEPPRQPLLPPGAIRLTAKLVLAIMVIGSAAYLFQIWRDTQEVVQAQVINANTGAITLYTVRRNSIEGRRFRTTDGRDIRLADVERLIVLPAEPGK